MRASLRCMMIGLLLAAAGAAQAAREAVLKQVDLPHSYYWRELYLPQLTTGPSSLSFMPDGDALIYSMGGSLWRQEIDSRKATELTHASAAYDYQPDVAGDGQSVVFARYNGAAIELWRLDLRTGREQALTSGGAVNIEPRLAPDGKQLAWVSTQGTGHFNLFIADIDAQGLHQPRPLLGERKSRIERYYYSAFDHAINPSWSPDGETIYFVGNPEVAWGSGDLWSVAARDVLPPRKVLSEETSWSAHPELAPDGKRLLYSSYHGRQNHQLWLTTTAGVVPLPLSFVDFDQRGARWSPDGRSIAYIDNRDGGTALRVMQVIGGATRTLVADTRKYKAAHTRLLLDIVDEHGRRTPARVSVQGSDGRAYAPNDAWMHSDDGFDRGRQTLEAQYFHCAPPCALDVPIGATRVGVQHGFAYAHWQQSVEVGADRESAVQVKLQPQALPEIFGQWISADLHVHMNYGGHYRNTPAHLAEQARAEDLDLVHNLIVNKEERIPDIARFRTDADPASTDPVTILHSQEYHTSFWGHLGLLHLGDHYLTPDFSAYRHTAMSSAYPHNGVIADLAHAQGGLVGYVHPFDWMIDPKKEVVLSHQLPADAINGKVDYLEVVGFSDHRATAAVWYRLLNLGLPIAAGAGTDAMANYASLRGPVGLNRTFLDTGGSRDPASAKAALKAGRGFVSNGPLLGLLLDDAKPGESLRADTKARRYRIALGSPVAVDHLELVHNGRVIKSFKLRGDRRQFDDAGDVELEPGGWVLLRAWNDESHPGVYDLYPYATTNPIWLGERAAIASAADDAQYFVDWLTRVLEAAEARDDYNEAWERNETLDYLRVAREKYRLLAMPSSPSPERKTP